MWLSPSCFRPVWKFVRVLVGVAVRSEIFRFISFIYFLLVFRLVLSRSTPRYQSTKWAEGSGYPWVHQYPLSQLPRLNGTNLPRVLIATLLLRPWFSLHRSSASVGGLVVSGHAERNQRGFLTSPAASTNRPSSGQCPWTAWNRWYGYAFYLFENIRIVHCDSERFNTNTWQVQGVNPNTLKLELPDPLTQIRLLLACHTSVRT